MPNDYDHFRQTERTPDPWRSEMPLPKWLAQINKRTFNKMEIKRGVRPVLAHVGRSSGKTYHTPLDAHKTDDGYIFIINYGSRSDWVKNILAAGTATLSVEGNEVTLVSPRVITKDVASQKLPATTKWPSDFMKVTECLQMDIGH
jgi:deazaflavin-dependent oxidoreductase (nitroreductase family)